MYGHKSLLAKPHLALGTHFINLKSHESATVSLESTLLCSNVQILLFGAFFGTLQAITLSKGHARSQIAACQASHSTADKRDQFEITRKHGRITLLNIYVFKSANIAVLGLLWHPPDYYLG